MDMVLKCVAEGGRLLAQHHRRERDMLVKFRVM